MLADRMLMCMNKRKIDRSEPVTVVNSAYTTSASARPQRLSNGWLVTAVYKTSYVVFYKSTDNGVNWSQLCWCADMTNSNFSVTSYGNIIYAIGTYSTTQIIRLKFDATAVTNTNQAGSLLDGSRTAVGGVSIAVNPSNGHLTAAWSCKDTTYPNSFNIRSAKSVDGGLTWTKQDGTAGVDQITTENSSGRDAKNPCIVVNNLGRPVILRTLEVPASIYLVYCEYYNGSTWLRSEVYNPYSNYAQSNPDAVVSPDGTIHVVWHGKSASYPGNNNIRYSKSIDNGVTWSAPLRLTSSISEGDQEYATINCNKNNEIYILWDGLNTRVSSTYRQILKIVYSGSWGSIITLTNNITNHSRYPSTCSNYTDFTDPLCIYQDNQAGAVKFRGVWNE